MVRRAKLPAEVLDHISVEGLGLGDTFSRRLREYAGAGTIGALLTMKESELLALPGFGEKKVALLVSRLDAIGLKLVDEEEEK